MRHTPAVLLVGLSMLTLVLGAGPADADTVELVSQSGIASQTPVGISQLSRGTVSADGRYVVFTSNAPNVVAGQVDTNGVNDVFLWDRVTGAITLVSRATGTTGTTANGGSLAPVISADGAFVAYLSAASNLVPGQTDPNGAGGDVFLFDRAAGTTTLVSRTAASATTTGNAASTAPVISADGNYVAFTSAATNVVSGQTELNGTTDVFVFDRMAGTTSLVSRAIGTATTTGNAGSTVAAISATGAFVVYQSTASNLVPGQADGNGAGNADLFVFDRVGGTTSLVSRAAGSATTSANGASSAAVISPDGAFIAYQSTATNLVPGQSDANGTGSDVFLFDRVAGTTTLVSRAAGTTTTTANSGSSLPAISANGAFVAYQSTASNLVPGQVESVGGLSDVFLFDRVAGTTTLVSRVAGTTTTTPSLPSSSPVISADGAFVAYESSAFTLVAGQVDSGSGNVFLFHRLSATTALVSRAAGTAATGGNGLSIIPVISADGAFIAYQSVATNVVSGLIDSNFTNDVFLFDRSTGTAALVSVAQGPPSSTAGGDSSNGSVSADGRYVVFTSTATNVVAGQVDTNLSSDVFLADRLMGTITLVSRAGGTTTTTGNVTSFAPVISADGAFVAYASSATNLVPGQFDANGSGSDVFLFDRVTGTTSIVSHAAGSATTTGNLTSSNPAISADGRFIAFQSNATNLVPGQVDPNGGLSDVFLYDRISGTTLVVSRAAGSVATTASAASSVPVLSADGRFVAYQSNATNLVPGQVDPNGALTDVFLFDRTTGATTLVSRAAGTSTTTGNQGSAGASISADGAFVVYQSNATNLVSGQVDVNGVFTDVFLFNRTAGTTMLVSRAAGTTTTTGASSSVSATISADGAFVAYASNATDLVPGQVDPNGQGLDVFLFDRVAGTTAVVSRAAGTTPTTGNGSASNPVITTDGAFVAYQSVATNLVPGQIDANGGTDVFLFNRVTGTATLASRFPATSTRTGNGSSSTLFTPTSATISADGSVLLFTSFASDLVADDLNANRDVFVFIHSLETPTAVGDSYSTDQNVAVTVVAPGVLANDTGASLTASLVSGPGHGAVVLNADGSFTYTPAAGFSGEDTFTYKAVDGAATESNVATVTITVQVVQVTPVITWAIPADITYPVPLGATQLNATADTAGTFEYSPPAGSILNAGAAQVLSVTFTPTDTTQYTTATKTVTINVLKATSVITWPQPAHITYGTPLSTTQLNATANVPGTFAYVPASGTILNVGNGQSLSVTFTPADVTNYSVVSTTVSINVIQGSAVITWPSPAAITYPTALSSVQLNATANVAGTFVYSPPAGTVLNAGNGQTLSVTFTPTDTANYNSSSATVQIAVLKASQAISVTQDAPPTSVYNSSFLVMAEADSGFPVSITTSGACSGSGLGAATIHMDAGTGTCVVHYNQAGDVNYNAAAEVANVTVAEKATQSLTVTQEPPSTAVFGDQFTVAATASSGLLATIQASGACTGSGSGSAAVTITAGNATCSITFDQVGDGNYGAATQIVRVVTSLNTGPVPVNGSVTTGEDNAVVITLSAQDVDNSGLTFVVTEPGHGTLSTLTPPATCGSNGSGGSVCTATVTYAPSADYNGSDSFTFRVNDGSVDSSPALVSVTITPVDDAPIANGQSVTGTEDTPLTISLVASDVDTTALSFTITSGPAHGTLSASNGAMSCTPVPNDTTTGGASCTAGLVYTPHGNFNGSDAFTFVGAGGASTSSPATVSIALSLVNDAPVAHGQTVAVTEDVAKVITLSATDVDSHGLTFGITGGPSHGALNVTTGAMSCVTDAAGLTTCSVDVTYTPDPSYNGVDSFTFTTNDNQFASTPATVSLTVSGVNDAPIAGNGSAATTQNAPVTIALAASDIDDVSLTLSIVNGASHGTLGTISGTTCVPGGGGSTCSATIAYTPAAGYAGPDVFTFKATDAGGLASNTATVSIMVTGGSYAFTGFFQPVDNPPIVNTVKAGQTIPQKWNILDTNGQPVSDPSSFVKMQSYAVSCADLSTALTSPIDELSPGASGLQYLGGGNWQFNWQTNKAWAGTCRRSILTLKDGTTHEADFRFSR